MSGAAISFLVVSLTTAHTIAQNNPAVVEKMAEIGTVYVTRAAPKDKTQPKTSAKANAVIGVDFRPMADADPKKIAALVKELSTIPDLESILLLGMNVTDEVADAIPTTPKLKSIQFFNTAITDKGIAKLSRLPNLEVFNFTGMGLTDEGMKALGKMKTLHTIEIVDAKITDAGVLALSGLPNLRMLTIQNAAASQRSVDQLQERLPRIEGRRFLR
jgi:Leucine Rich repeat